MKKRKKIRHKAASCETSNVVIPTTSQQYEELFFKKAKSTTRDGKVFYIRKEFHERIMRIVQVIGENDYSLFSYLDNVLEHHFATYRDEITKLYRERNTDVF